MKDKVEKNKKIIIGILTAVVVVMIVAIIVVSVSNTPKTDFPDVNEGPGEEVDEKSLVFYNRDILTEVYNRSISATILDDIQSVVFSSEEMAFSFNNVSKEGNNNIYYDATIELSSFSSLDSYTSKFRVKISDSRVYNVLTRADSLNDEFSYVYVAILREGGEKIFLMFNGDEKDKDGFSSLVEEIIE